MGQDNKLPSRELKKHAAIIHCSNTLSLLQRKISNALLYHAYPDLSIKDEHEITVKELCRLIGYQGHNHAVIRDAMRELLATVIEWNLIDDASGQENWTASSILASVSLEGPLCYYAYSPRMKQLLYSPAMFGRIDLIIQSKFRSNYGLALYENCIRYRGLPQTKWLDIELFKKLMGVPSSKYNLFRDFKRRVLDKAIDEVNTYSDLVIQAEYSKEGRRVAKVRFKLKERAKKNRLGQAETMLPADLSTALQRYGLSKEQIAQVLRDYDSQLIKAKMQLIEASPAFTRNKIQNLSAYLLSALKNDYQPPKTAIAVSKTSALADNWQAVEREIDGIRQAYNRYREKVIEDAIDNLAETKREALYLDFHAFAEPVILTILQLQRHKYTRDNVFTSPQVKALLRRFAVRELAMPIPSLEEFVENQTDAVKSVWETLKSHDPLHPLLRFNE